MIRMGRRCPAAIFAMLFALMMQLAAFAAAPPPAAAEPGFAPICHAGSKGNSAPAPQHHHSSDCVLCPACIAMTIPAPALGTGPALPAPRVTRLARAIIPFAGLTPSSPRLIAAQPRAPPRSA
jgi:hypothetical protein